jgi:hypothetical protein
MVPPMPNREEYEPARKGLEQVFGEFNRFVGDLAEEAWSKELVRLMKDAIAECNTGMTGLGQYAIMKLRDTAMNWYMLEYMAK